MKAQDLAWASNLVFMQKQYSSLLSDLDRGLEVNPKIICEMFPWPDCLVALRPLVEKRLKGIEQELLALDIVEEV